MKLVPKKRVVWLIILAFLPNVAKENKQQADKTKNISFEEAIYNWMGTMAEVCQKTEQKHYKIADPQNCMINAINGFLSCLDPHSSFLDPKTYTSMLESTSGQFFGVGVILDNTRQTKDGFLLAIDVLPDGPAEKAGLQRLDKIVEIDGKALDGMTTEEATSRLKGDRHTKVHVKVLREGQQDILSFDIVRDVIKEQNSQAFYLPQHNICYIALNVFSDTSVKQMEHLIQYAQHHNHKAIIIDIRNNSGGLVTSATDIAGLCIKKGSLVARIKDRNGIQIEQYSTVREPILDSALPIFFLTNNYTASAAEILAGCLKFYSENSTSQKQSLMTFLVGTRTFGKGSVQEIIPVSNNCAMKITIALYFLPSDIAIQGVGIEPDFIVEQQLPRTEQMKWFARFYGQENALRNYINPSHDKQQEAEEKKNVKTKENGKDEKTKSWFERTKEILKHDNQLAATITLANLYHELRTLVPNKMKSRLEAIAYMKKIYALGEDLSIVEIQNR